MESLCSRDINNVQHNVWNVRWLFFFNYEKWMAMSLRRKRFPISSWSRKLFKILSYAILKQLNISMLIRLIICNQSELKTANIKWPEKQFTRHMLNNESIKISIHRMYSYTLQVHYAVAHLIAFLEATQQQYLLQCSMIYY